MTWKYSIVYLLLTSWSIYAQFTASNVNPISPFSELATTRVFTTLEGKTADPCNKYTTPLYPDCQTVPDSQVTILIPAASSPTSPMVTAVLTDAQTVTITGRNFPAAYVTGSVFFVVGDPFQGCAGPITVNDITVAAAVGAFSASADTTITFVVRSSWATVERELEARPRPLCVSHTGVNGPWYYTGFKIGVVWNCVVNAGISNCPPAPAGTNNFLSGYQSLTFMQLQERANRKTCCKTTIGTMNVGQCIFSPADNSQSPTACCGGAQIELSTEKCCSARTEWTSYLTNPCPCTSSAGCATNETCCLPTKYSEFTSLITAGGLLGECVGGGYSCCDTGVRYNPGSQQCCVINGVQSANVPCPCSVDTHCQRDADAAAMRCCTQVNTTGPLETNMNCNAYANFPTGTAPYQIQRCPGSCFDTSYQICCNGVMCNKNYEKCCNNTCCNRWSETCQMGRRAAAVGNRYNWNDFNVKYETCTAVEAQFPARGYVNILHPIYCLIMSLFSTGICLIFANKASSRSYSAIEKAMIYIAVICIIFDLILYFSPSWKYGLFILFVQCFTILTAATRVKKLNIWCLILTVVLIIYLVDPFHGNQYLTLASSRTVAGQPDRDSAGLIHHIGRMYKNYSEVNGGLAFCQWNYLGYFTLDPQLRDTDRFDNPARTTYGYCDRGYVLLLLVFCALIYVCVLIQFMLVLLALLLRFNKPHVSLASEE
jgi:hypothetical protein